MSITRRAFLHGITWGAYALPIGGPSELGAPGCLRFDKVIVDARRSHGLAFAEAVRRSGGNAQACFGDISLECQSVFSRLHTEKRAVAGLTDFRSFFILQAMAADAGLHPILRIHHDTRDHVDAHETFGPQTYRSICESRLVSFKGCWAQQAAHIVLNLPALELATRRYANNLSDANLRVLASRSMVTWAMV